jgi:hypothetical protein
LRVDEKAAEALPAAVKSRVTLDQGGYYMGQNPSAPAVGDERITFQVVRPATVSIVARQIGNTFEAYQARAGGRVLLVKDGTESADSMFTAAESANATLTWILRGAGFFAMALGLFLIFSLLAVVASVVPLFGNLMDAGSGLCAFVLAACLSLVTIAVSWIVFRPLIGILLLAAAGVGFFGLARLAHSKTTIKAAQTVS